jgi:nucleotide-binding universal stress UspA family protein
MSGQTVSDLAGKKNERHILIAVDGSENSKRAVIYVADFFGRYRDVFITLLSIVPEPSEDYFATDGERDQWLEEKKTEMNRILAEYKEILTGRGFQEEQLEVLLIIRVCTSIGEAILEEQERLGCSMVVVGRRGISHNEEFIFGSTSNKILHQAKNCAVMVIE